MDAVAIAMDGRNIVYRFEKGLAQIDGTLDAAAGEPAEGLIVKK